MAASNVPPHAGEESRAICCLYCHKQQEVARRAVSVTCRFCHKRLRLEDIAITSYEAKRFIDTCGVIVVEAKGTAVTEAIRCGGLIVRGKVKGTIESQGTVSVGAKGNLKGDVTAPALVVGAGAVLEGRYEIRGKKL